MNEDWGGRLQSDALLRTHCFWANGEKPVSVGICVEPDGGVPDYGPKHPEGNCYFGVTYSIAGDTWREDVNSLLDFLGAAYVSYGGRLTPHLASQRIAVARERPEKVTFLHDGEAQGSRSYAS